MAELQTATASPISYILLLHISILVARVDIALPYRKHLEEMTGSILQCKCTLAAHWYNVEYMDLNEVIPGIGALGPLGSL